MKTKRPILLKALAIVLAAIVHTPSATAQEAQVVCTPIKAAAAIGAIRRDPVPVKSAPKRRVTPRRETSSPAPYFSVSSSSVSFGADGGTKTLYVSTNEDWNISTRPGSWGHLTRNGNELTLSVDFNDTNSPRNDFFVLRSSTQTVRVSISQTAMTVSTYAYSGTTRQPDTQAKGNSYLTGQIQEWGQCRCGSFTDDGKGIAVYSDNGYASKDIDPGLYEDIDQINSSNQRINSVAITKYGYYCVVYGNNGWSGAVPDEMKQKLGEFNADKEDIKCVSITESGEFAIVTDKHLYASKPSDAEAMRKAVSLYGYVRSVCVTDTAICVVCVKGTYYSNVPEALATKFKSLKFVPTFVTFTDSGTYLITNDKGSYDYLL